jgi:hypothetical protein
MVFEMIVFLHRAVSLPWLGGANGSHRNAAVGSNGQPLRSKWGSTVLASYRR